MWNHSYVLIFKAEMLGAFLKFYTVNLSFENEKRINCRSWGLNNAHATRNIFHVCKLHIAFGFLKMLHPHTYSNNVHLH